MNLQLTMINKQHLVRTREEELVWSGFDVRSATALATPLHWSRFSVLSAKLSRRPVINSRTYHLKRINLLPCLLLQKFQYTVFNLQWGLFFGLFFLGGGVTKWITTLLPQSILLLDHHWCRCPIETFNDIQYT